jgi:hypothetical protein
VSEYRGVAAGSALDAAAGTGTSSSTTAPTPTITTTNPSDLVVAAINYPGSGLSALNGTAFSALQDFDVLTVNGRAAYQVTTTAGAQQASWTLSNSANSGGAILALKGAQ